MASYPNTERKQQQQRRRRVNIKTASSSSSLRGDDAGRRRNGRQDEKAKSLSLSAQSRYELTHRIRKVKRHETLTLKRRLRSSSPESSFHAATTAAPPYLSPHSTTPSKEGDEDVAQQREVLQRRLNDLATTVVMRALQSQNDASARAATEEALAGLQTALAKKEADSESISNLLLPIPLETSASSVTRMQLAEALAWILGQQHDNDLVTPNMRLDASRILTNLAACDDAATTASVASIGMSDDDDDDDQSNEGDFSYYGPSFTPPDQDQGWCDVLVRSPALSALVQTVQSFLSRNGSLGDNQNCTQASAPERTDVLLCEQCCWAIGNLAGDSDAARSAARSANAVPPLVGVTRMALKWGQANASFPVVGLCRNATWALSNLARGASTCALPFLAVSSPILLTTTLLAELLVAPELMEQGARSSPEALCDAGSVACPSSWMDVAHEACWLLAFLTAREDEAVDFLCANTTSGESLPQASVIFQALATRLSRTSQEVAKEAEGMTSSLADVSAARVAVPCIRSIGNVATACRGRFVPQLITTVAGPQTTSSSIALTVPHALAQLIAAGSSSGGEISGIASEAAWAAGTLVCDAGRPGPHPSTAACAILIPTLCNVLTSGFSRLELQREAAGALWNATSAHHMEKCGKITNSPPVGSLAAREERECRHVRDAILTQMVASANGNGIVQALTKLLQSRDMDAAFAGLRLMDAMLRRLQDVELDQVRRWFEESHGVDALESICDAYDDDKKYGAGDASLAEMAADLIDDVFAENDGGVEDGDDDDHALPVFSSSPLTAFSFGPFPTHVPKEPIFVGGGGGRGRGRGRVLPAWMQQQEN